MSDQSAKSAPSSGAIATLPEIRTSNEFMTEALGRVGVGAWTQINTEICSRCQGPMEATWAVFRVEELTKATRTHYVAILKCEPCGLTLRTDRKHTDLLRHGA